MKPYKVYPLFDITPVRADGSWLWDEAGNRYLDFYGGHAVISIGHCHPHYRKRISDQLEQLGFYSNSVKIEIQHQLAAKLGALSGYRDYSLFLCNSGAEANENALKLASFQNGRRKVIAFENGFHGRTSAAVAMTDNRKIIAPVNEGLPVELLPLNDRDKLAEALSRGDVAAVIVEGIQGIAGIYQPETQFLQQCESLCRKHGTVLILDEIQSGYGRSGKFFAHQFADIRPDLITVAKGMGNGFPIGGVLISPDFEAVYGRLGSTFGGNHLACAAGLAVLEVIESENLITNALEIGRYLMDGLAGFSKRIREVRGSGLMIGVELGGPCKPVREQLLYEERIFTGSSKHPNVLRLLPSLAVTKDEVDIFFAGLEKVLS